MFQYYFQRNVVAISEDACREYIDNTPLIQRSHRLDLESIENTVRKTMRAYRSKEFHKFFVVADSANDVDFVKEINLYIIRLIFVICFFIFCILY